MLKFVKRFLAQTTYFSFACGCFKCKMYRGYNPLKKRIFPVDEGKITDEGNVGDKGVQISHLAAMSIPVPPSFLISAATCAEFLAPGAPQTTVNSFLVEDCEHAVLRLEKSTGKVFGMRHEKLSRDGESGKFDPAPEHDGNVLPLLLTLRSASTFTILGKEKTILGLGMTDYVARKMVDRSHNPFWAWDTYRRFLQDYGIAVLGVEASKFDEILTASRQERKVEDNSSLTVEDLKAVVEKFKAIAPVPQSPWKQLFSAIRAMYQAWAAPTAVEQRKAQDIHQRGLPLLVQSMVYCNKDNECGSGTIYTRNPQTGEKVLCGHYNVRCLGDLHPLFRESTCTPSRPIRELQTTHPDLYHALSTIAVKLERYHQDMQAVDFAFERDDLYVLQTKSGRRTVSASIKILVSLMEEGILTKEGGILRIKPEQMQHYQLGSSQGPTGGESYCDLGKEQTAVGPKGLVSGKLKFDPDEVMECRRESGEPCILCTASDHYAGFQASAGVIKLQSNDVTATLLMLKNLRKMSVISVGYLTLGSDGQSLLCDGGSIVFHKDETITIDTAERRIYKGGTPTVSSGPQDKQFKKLLGWADHYKRLPVKAVVSATAEVESAHALGADGLVIRGVEKFLPQNVLSAEIFMTHSPLMSDQPSIITPARMKYGKLVHILSQFRGRRVTFHLSDELNLTKIRASAVHVQGNVSKVPFEPVKSPLCIEGIVGAIIEARQLQIDVMPCILIPGYHQDLAEGIYAQVRQLLSKAHIESKKSGRAFFSTTCELGVVVESVRGCLSADSLVMAGSARVDCIAFAADQIAESLLHMSGKGEEETTAIEYGYCIMAPHPSAMAKSKSVGEMIGDSVKKCRELAPDIKVMVTGEHCADLNAVRYFNWLNVESIACSVDRVPIIKIAAAQAEVRKNEK